MNIASSSKLINKDLNILFRLKQLYIALEKYYDYIWTSSSFSFPLLVLFCGGLQKSDPVRFSLGGQKAEDCKSYKDSCLFWVEASKAHRLPYTRMQ